MFTELIRVVSHDLQNANQTTEDTSSGVPVNVNNLMAIEKIKNTLIFNFSLPLFCISQKHVRNS